MSSVDVSETSTVAAQLPQCLDVSRAQHVARCNPRKTKLSTGVAPHVPV